MKTLATAATGVALAIATTAAFAAPGDAWYGTNRPGERVITTPSFGPLAPETSERVTVYYDEPVQPAPVIVEREYVTTPPLADVVVVEPVRESGLFHVEPRTYSRIGRGLFPDKGPNDFGQ
jgi:hypothetical protein